VDTGFRHIWPQQDLVRAVLYRADMLAQYP